MPKAKIYQPDKNAMQSGRARTKKWVLEFIPQKPYFVDSLMGWVGMTDTQTEVKLQFDTQADAISYANNNKLEYEVLAPNPRKPIRKAYADNFAFKKRVG
jgi:hypothetical protein